MGVAAVSEKFGDVRMLWFVFSCQLRRMKVEPPFDLFLAGKLVEMWWCFPRRVGASHGWNVGKFRLGHVCDLVVSCGLLIGPESDGCVGAAAGAAV